MNGGGLRCHHGTQIIQNVPPKQRLVGSARCRWRQQQRRTAVAAAAPAAEPPRGPLSAWQRWWALEPATDCPGSGSGAEPEAAAAAAAGAAGMQPGVQPMTTSAIVRQVGALLAPDRSLMAAAVVFMLAAAAAELAIPHYITAAIFAATKVGGH